MGGLGSGGKRPGSGRKPKSEAERRLDGNAGHRGRVLAHPSAPDRPVSVAPTAAPPAAPGVEEFDAPNDLTMEERHVWMELAPHAFENGTLTKATSLAFRLLCRNIVLERRYGMSILEAGTANHRGMIQRIDAELLRFSLAPCGKPLSAGDKMPEVDPLQAKYFG